MYLMDVLQKVRGLIAQHGAALQQNEMLTRYMLIDPVLRALGWDTEDPDVVVPECTTANGRMDYAPLLEQSDVYRSGSKGFAGQPARRPHYGIPVLLAQ